MRVYRPALVREMQQANRELLDSGLLWDEILAYLINKFRPTFIELRSTLYRIQEFIRTGKDQSDTGLLAYKLLRRDIRIFNREHKYEQLIGTEKQEFEAFNERTAKPVTRVRWLLGLAIGKIAEESDERHAKQIKGLKEKRAKLKAPMEDPDHFRREANKLMMRIERRRRGSRK